MIIFGGAFLSQFISLFDKLIDFNVLYWLVGVARVKSFVDFVIVLSLIYAYDVVAVGTTSTATTISIAE